MSIVTLTSDFGTKDYFVSSTKAAIINEIKSVNIIDISHQIRSSKNRKGSNGSNNFWIFCKSSMLNSEARM